MSENENLTIDFDQSQQSALSEIGLEVTQLSIDASTGTAELVAPRKPGLVRLTSSQSTVLKQRLPGSPEIVGIETNPRTFGVKLISISDSRKIKAMWGEGSE